MANYNRRRISRNYQNKHRVNHNYDYNYQEQYNNHPEHPIRDMFFATLTCLGAISFALLWWGMATGERVPLIIGISSSAIAFVSVIVCFIKALVNYKKH